VKATAGYEDQAAVGLQLSGDSARVLIEVWDADPRSLRWTMVPSPAGARSITSRTAADLVGLVTYRDRQPLADIKAAIAIRSRLRISVEIEIRGHAARPVSHLRPEALQVGPEDRLPRSRQTPVQQRLLNPAEGFAQL
jgi:hypothetical protein